jgi:hypothetical protein
MHGIACVSHSLLWKRFHDSRFSTINYPQTRTQNLWVEWWRRGGEGMWWIVFPWLGQEGKSTTMHALAFQSPPSLTESSWEVGQVEL